MISVVAAAALTGLANAHSWLHCSDYRGDLVNYEADQCVGHPRPIGGRVPDQSAFGQDTGFNQQPGDTACHSSEASLASFPMATYQRGQTITLAWPTKNHVAAECTNPFIPDTATELFVAPFTSTATANPAWTQVRASFSDDPHVNGQIDFKGFQNCPDFCNNMDKALCTGTFVVPADLTDGTYTFQWRWEFNQGSPAYVTCFEAQVAGTATNPGPTPTGPAPTPRPTGTPRPTTAAQANCGSEGSQCDGALFSGETCCAAGLTCFQQSTWFSQCLPSCPDDSTWACSSAAGAVPCAQMGEQCGGKFHVGSMCCDTGSCMMNSPFYAECRNDCPLGWQCNKDFAGSFNTGGSSSGASGGWVAFFLFLAMASCLGGAFIAKKVLEHRLAKAGIVFGNDTPTSLKKQPSGLMMPPNELKVVKRKSSAKPKPPSGPPPPPMSNVYSQV